MIKSNRDTCFNLTICEIFFRIPIYNNQSINAVNFIFILGKWFINNSRSLNKPINFKNFLRTKINEKILSNAVNNMDAQLWEIDMLIAL